MSDFFLTQTLPGRLKCFLSLGDLTSNINDLGIGEVNSKRVARQVGSALDWMHSKNLCHLDVKLDNILVFRSDFSRVKLCDFGSVKSQGDIVIKKNELLPYCPPELVAKHANEYLKAFYPNLSVSFQSTRLYSDSEDIINHHLKFNLSDLFFYTFIYTCSLASPQI